MCQFQNRKHCAFIGKNPIYNVAVTKTLCLQRVSPEIKSGGDGLVGDTDVQASEVVLWIAVGVAFVKVAVPINHNTNGAALENRTQIQPYVASRTC